MFNPQDRPAVYTIGTMGDINGWVKFFEKGNLITGIKEVTVPAKKYYDIIAVIKVPEGTPNGKYEGEIFIKEAPSDPITKEDNTVFVSQMVSRPVTITVTDEEIVRLEAKAMPENYDIGSGQALKIRMVYENLGNIAIKPDCQLKITKDGQSIFNAIFPYPETEETIKPAETKNMSYLEWQSAGQDNGRYYAEFTVLSNGETLAKSDFYFNIGTFPVSEKVDEKGIAKLLAAISAVGGGNTALGWIAAGAIVLLFAGSINMIMKFRKPKNQWPRSWPL
jgi:hypothetical protein